MYSIHNSITTVYQTETSNKTCCICISTAKLHSVTHNFQLKVLQANADTILNQSSKSWHSNIPPAVQTHTYMNYIRLHRKQACKYWP